MSRSGYTDDCEYIELYRNTVERAIKGKRGQAFLRELAAAMDAMPEKILIAHELVNEDGDHCALGAVGAKRGIDMSKLDPEEPDDVARAFNIASALAKEIVYENDECGDSGETPQQRWTRVRKWVAENIKDPK